MLRKLSNYYHLELPVPGISKNNLSLRLEDRLLIIEGQQKQEWQTMQSLGERMTNYKRSLYLPSGVSAEQIKAKVKNGMLTIAIFKQNQHNHTRTIPINGNGKEILTKNNIWTKKLVQNLKNSFREFFK